MLGFQTAVAMPQLLIAANHFQASVMGRVSQWGPLGAAVSLEAAPSKPELKGEALLDDRVQNSRKEQKSLYRKDLVEKYKGSLE